MQNLRPVTPRSNIRQSRSDYLTSFKFFLTISLERFCALAICSGVISLARIVVNCRSPYPRACHICRTSNFGCRPRQIFFGFLIPLMLVDAAEADLVIAFVANPVQKTIVKLPSTRAARCHADDSAHQPRINQSAKEKIRQRRKLFYYPPVGFCGGI